MFRRTLVTIAVGILLASGTAAVDVASAPPAAAAWHAIHLGKIQYDPPGKDTRTNRKLNAEYVVIKNVSRRAHRLDGWTLWDRQRHAYHIHHLRLRAGHAVRIHTGRGIDTASNRYQDRSWYVWNNTGDRATLRNKSGHLIDRCAWKRDRRYKIC